MIDSHAHLNSEELYPQLDEFLIIFADQGGEAVLNVGHSPETNFEALDLARKRKNIPNPKIYTAIGLHPEIFSPTSFYAQKFDSYDAARKALRQYEAKLEENIQLVDAIGETGLDYYRLFETDSLTMEQKEEYREIQLMAFRKHCELALKHNKPLTIHTREQKGSTRAIDDTLAIISEIGKGTLKGSFHSYTGDHNYLDDIFNLGFYIGVNAIVTYPSADDVRELCKQIPDEKLLLETDTPWLPPQSVRQNKKLSYRLGQPADIKEIAFKVAEVRGVSVEEILQLTTNNFKTLFANG